MEKARPRSKIKRRKKASTELPKKREPMKLRRSNKLRRRPKGINLRKRKRRRTSKKMSRRSKL